MRKPVFAAALLVALVLATPVLSHDFWLIPSSFHLAPGSELTVHGQTSSDFPTSLSAVTKDRIASAQLITPSGQQDVADLGVSGTSLRLGMRVREVGQAVVAVAIHPRSIPESPESFRRYLTLEGAPEALARYEREGLLPTDSITRRYAKYAKSLVEIGSGGPRVFDRTVEHPLEFVPVSDPHAAGAGGSLRFRMLFLGEPVANARGHISVAASSGAESAHDHAEFETDARGEFAVSLGSDGIWNVRALHIVPAPAGSGADWDVHWATFVWSVE